MQSDMSPIVTQYAMSSLETMLINTPNPRYEMTITPYNNRPQARRSPISFFYLLDYEYPAFPNLEVRWTFGLSGAQKSV